jgi:NAD(P)-dependent dehydrogenase (short-subunit alcohol dehydrogenase family)
MQGSSLSQLRLIGFLCPGFLIHHKRQGAFTPLGLTLLHSLAERGAHIIAISPDPIDSPKVDILVSLLRSTTNNEQIYAEECDLTSAKSVRSLCTRFLTSESNRLDAIVFAHEYSHIGSIFSAKMSVLAEKERQTRSLATFLMITLLLPILLVAPSERDIRILNVVNPFYAAAVTSFSPKPDPLHDRKSIILQEGRRSLQTIILTRHLQRVLDSMPQGSHVPKTEESVVPVVSAKLQRSNIVSVSVSPGISRMGTIAPMLSASGSDSLHFSYLGVVW